ncbi:MAG TPA: hypothetical protein ENK66_01990 [Arcobacter sp.]|nr:hypothetical protein [Arcobacter sp.]
MEEVNMVSEAFKFMALGMGIVFTFLSIMVVVLKLQAKLINKFFAEEPKAKGPTKEWQPQSEDDKQITAAITAAIIHHNNKG